MGYFRFLAAALALAAAQTSTALASGERDHAKPRVIIMTDGEIDDQSSMIRFLLSINEVELSAVIETNSVWQRYGHSREDWYENQLEAYAKIHSNLLIHDADYPSAAEIKRKSFVGDEDPAHLVDVAEEPARSQQHPGRSVEYLPNDWPDTPGSDRIVEVLLKKNPAPVHIQAWGGGNTAARAFYKLKTEHPLEYSRAVAKVVMYNISYQDDAGNYIEKYHPGVTMIYNAAFYKSWAYGIQTETTDLIINEVKRNHGSLGALYPQSYVSEGDTPAFLYVMGNGLRNDEHPTFGGWGGRFVKQNERLNVYSDARDDGDLFRSLNRWVHQANSDFQARLDWAASSDYAAANHHPIIRHEGKLNRVIKPGQHLTLTAKGTTDPDGDAVTFRWWQYRDAGTSDGVLSLTGASSPTVRLKLPESSKAGTVHLILEVADNGTPKLVTYKRFVLTVQEQ